MQQSHIRNFCVVAHIDHGKSTLADRLLEMTGTVAHRDMRAQILDSNPIERERGITIKLAPVRMKYKSNQLSVISNQKYNTDHRSPITDNDFILNLIDTPGHVDFGYEVSRSLAACEGALLVVDATQGVQAQTLANLHQARQHKLTVIPLINKIDMPTARIAEAIQELKSLGFREEEIIRISAKTGENVENVLEAIVDRIPPPKGDPEKPPRALVFSSQYDAHKGVVVFVRIVDGSIQFSSSTRLQFMASGASVTPIEMGYFTPQLSPIGTGEKLSAGEVGYIATGLKDVRFAKVGDTITLSPDHPEHPYLPDLSPLPGYKEPKPMVFLRLFPINSEEFSYARETMEKLRLSDSAFTFRPISSLALGNGFHCGFLGLLHAEIVQERLSREFDLNMIATAPSVEYHLTLMQGVIPAKAGIHHAVIPGPARDDNVYSIQSAAEFPDPTFIQQVFEPIMNVVIYTPKRYVGPIMQLAQEKRGTYVDLTYHADQAEFTYRIPLSDMIIDFFDRLKSITEGYASLDYEFFDYKQVDVAKIDILVNKEKVDALSFLVVRDQAHARSIEITDRLAAVIPRQQFEVPIQAAIGGKVVARSDVKAFRKDVIAKLYGGDRTRKDKLLKKQKKGKARMKLIGRVEIPQEAFFEVLKRE
jgi:GTP-binding protein LepA